MNIAVSDYMADRISDVQSESGIIATLIHKPDYLVYSDFLKPKHFTNKENKCMYMAISNLFHKNNVASIDPYNIISYLNSSRKTKEFANVLTIEKLTEFINMSDVLARHTPEEYKMIVKNVMDTAFRREVFLNLKSCEDLCLKGAENIEQRIYTSMDSIIAEYSMAGTVPQFKDVIDECWTEIVNRQNDGYAGIPFKFKTLNEYATIEPGELFIFAAEAKQGKSMMLLNCAVDLLRQGRKVLYLDSELNTRLFTARILSHLSGVEYRRLTSGNYTEEEKEKISSSVDWMKKREFTHIYIPIFDPKNVLATVKKIHHMYGVDVLIVDYFKGSGEGDAFNSYQELGRFVDMVKNQICGGMGICGIGAAQATSNGRVADSAKIGRNASTIALIQDKTPEEVEEDGPECGNKKLRVILNRNGMQHAYGEYIDLQFNGNIISYEEAKQHIPTSPY